MSTETLTQYRILIQERHYRLAIVSMIAFIAGLVYNFYAGVYATSHASHYVEDIILSNIPSFEVGWIFVWGALALIIFIVGLCLVKPLRIPFVLYALALFYTIRGTFVALTHLAPYPTRVELNVDLGTLFAKQFSGSDLFFSAHTGVPFLMALVFWRYKVLRVVFLVWSFVFAAVVLLGHLHYSIDVLSAFFITYTIYQLTVYLFPRAYELFHRRA